LQRRCGAFSIDAPVAAYLPSWNRDGKRHLTLRHLLNHVSGAHWLACFVGGLCELETNFGTTACRPALSLTHHPQKTQTKIEKTLKASSPSPTATPP
jgi:CubicO group peptidase (beta-lactamase class C family)